MDGPVSPASVYDSLKARLVAGTFAAGAKLKPDVLRADYGIGATALREVLLRLTGEGLIAMEEQRGFHVPEASETLLNETLQLRLLIESECARLSIAHGDLEWEARLNAAHHKLAHLENRMRNHPAERLCDFIDLWTRTDWEFHEVLASAAPSRTLRDAHLRSFERYRQQVVAMVPAFGFRDQTLVEHDAILKVAIDRNPVACHAAIEAHLLSHRAVLTATRHGAGVSDVSSRNDARPTKNQAPRSRAAKAKFDLKAVS